MDDFTERRVHSVTRLEQQKANLKSQAFQARYKISTGKAKNANGKQGGIFSKFIRAITTDTLEMTKESHLPV